MRTVFLLFSVIALVAAQPQEHSRSLAPWVPTPQEIVDKLLEAGEVKANEVVYDLGAGDGRVLIAAAKKYNAKAVGIEISPKLVETANRRIEEEGLRDRCTVIQGDLREMDLSRADVVVLYLLTSSNELLRPNLEKSLKPGARVVSHDFEVRGWNPVRVVMAQAHGRVHRIYVYKMPISK